MFTAFDRTLRGPVGVFFQKFQSVKSIFVYIESAILLHYGTVDWFKGLLLRFANELKDLSYKSLSKMALSSP